ncbi:MAG: hypothetical protein IRY95_10210, partial [Clostridia bacterium]|nr:hypothetical protein [Clostridia bacterium]
PVGYAASVRRRVEALAARYGLGAGGAGPGDAVAGDAGAGAGAGSGDTGAEGAVAAGGFRQLTLVP